MEHLANHDRHGYSQEYRNGTGWTEDIDVGDGIYVRIHDEYDCSSAVIDSYDCQGIDTGGATYTLNMYELVNTGNFESIPLDQMSRGDILNSTVRRHAAMYLGNGKLAEALRGDSPDGLGGIPGDQDGQEIRIADYYDDAWTACYRCTVPSKDGLCCEHGRWYYYRDGSPVQNEWIKWDGEWYYCNWQGIMLESRWIESEDKSCWYYVDSKGRMVRNQPVEWNDGWCWADSLGRVFQDGHLKIVDWHIQS
jgi:hypothetical protein